MPLEINLPLVKADEYAKTFGARTADPSSLPSGMLAGPRYNLDRQNIFVKRNPAMNEVPLFYGDFETEIASLAAVQAIRK